VRSYKLLSSASFHHQTALALHICETLLHYYQVCWLKGTYKSSKMEGNNNGHICTTWYHWKVGVKPSDIHCELSIYLQFVERKHLHTALCSTGCLASTVARKMHRWLSMSGTITPLKSSFMKPSRSFQGECSNV
jgi:hypothetical protein